MRLLHVFIMLCAALHAPSCEASATEPELEAGIHIAEPRPFGHFVGDLIERTVYIDAARDEELVPASIPRAGQLAYWLDLRKVNTSTKAASGRQQLIITLTYQLFYVPVDTRKVAIPPLSVQVRSPAGVRRISIPSFKMLISPIREIYPEKSGETSATFLRPDAKPDRVKTGAIRTAALSSALVSIFACLGLAHHYAWWPFRNRAARPFAEAVRRIRWARERSEDGSGYREGVLALHRAFDAANGRRMLASDIDAFFEVKAGQTVNRTSTEKFFEASRVLFFEVDAQTARSTLSITDLSRLAHALAAAERRTA